MDFATSSQSCTASSHVRNQMQKFECATVEKSFMFGVLLINTTQNREQFCV